ncbi:acyl-CoA dehydrogenase family protein [Solwaraspora sp. WMMB335]|uniref:acyl-CoA dehydrogenase family protein n=1 Tax=Solwaraspora sp. WMMB335 TaxID=3404118 RepID=UPI003B94CCE5
MRFALTEDQVTFRDAVADLLAAECPAEVVRAAWPGGDPKRLDRLWAALADMGVFAAALPESAGGLGLADVDLAPVLIATGYAAVPLPVAETAAVVGPLLAALGDPGGHLDAITAGRCRVAIAGASGLIPYGQRADLALLPHDPDGPRLVALDAATATTVSTMDGSRAALRLATERPGGAEPGVRPGAVPADPLRLDAPTDLLALTADRATLAAAAHLVGLGRRLLDLTVAHVSTRRQFGAPVGSFQAVKHQLADALRGLELAEPVVLAAAWSAATGAASRPVDVSAGYLLAADAADRAARTALQCHGAIGYTVEYDLHLYAKRVWALTADNAGTDAHLDRIGTAIGLPAATARTAGLPAATARTAGLPAATARTAGLPAVTTRQEEAAP